MFRGGCSFLMWILRVTIYCFTFVTSNFFILFAMEAKARKVSSSWRVTFLPAPSFPPQGVIISCHHFTFTILLYVLPLWHFVIYAATPHSNIPARLSTNFPATITDSTILGWSTRVQYSNTAQYARDLNPGLLACTVLYRPVLVLYRIILRGLSYDIGEFS